MSLASNNPGHTAHACLLGTQRGCDACEARVGYERISQCSAEAEVALARLKDLQRKAATRMNSAHDPTQRMPLEIKLLIFEYAVKGQSICPLILGRICRSWRQMAWSASRLWDSVEFLIYPKLTTEWNTSSSQEASLPRRVQLLKEYLSRSLNRPLTLMIYPGHGFDDELVMRVGDSLLPIVAAVKDCAARLTGLQVYLPNPSLRLFEDIEAPNLQNLSVGSLVSAMSISPPISLHALTKTVKTLLLHDFTYSIVELSGGVVQDLLMEDCDPTFCIDVLRALPSLETCELVMLRVSLDSLPLNSSATSFPRFDHLSVLTIKYAGPSDISELFADLDTPRLTELSLSSGDSNGIRIQPRVLAQFLHRSSCPLQALQLGVAGCNATALEQILTQVPVLRYLAFRDFTAAQEANAIFEAVVPYERPGRSGVVLPSLCQLAYYTDWPEPDDRHPRLWGCFAYLQGWSDKMQPFVFTLYIQFNTPNIPQGGWLPLEILNLVEGLKTAGHQISVFAGIADGSSNVRFVDLMAESYKFHQGSSITGSVD